ncbi:hypothetical protein GCM10022254_32850 [Actinomadura meridiana]|uniref:Uncharacterized protein n=1 Tax=Actinomadura meridiana TaxID=559626 RepID=A0ABP8C2R4_9ACTN
MAIGISAAAVVATGSATAIAGAEDPTLSITVAATDNSVDRGESATILTTAKVNTGKVTKLDLTKVELKAVPDKGKPHVASGCGADAKPCGLLNTDGKLVEVKTVVSLTDTTIEEPVDVTVTITVEGTVEGQPVTDSRPATVKFSPPPDPSPDPSESSETPGGGKNTTGHPSKPAKPTKKTPSSPASGSGGSSKSSGSGGSSSTRPSTGGVLPPVPNSSFDPRNPQVALPPIAPPGAQDPSVAAPSPNMTPQSRLQGNQAPVAQDLTFDRMARTQIAWLAALLVAFSLLLTQLRLGRRRLPAGAAAKKTKGTHRRPRRGSFGK